MRKWRMENLGLCDTPLMELSAKILMFKTRYLFCQNVLSLMFDKVLNMFLIHYNKL